MANSIGINPTPVNSQAHRPSYYNGDLKAIVDDLVRRVTSAQKMLELKADTASLARILLTDNDIVLMADQVALLGNVTFGDWLRDVNGSIVGGIEDTSLTQIRGGVIKTGKIYSWDQKTYIDLDGSNSDFIHSRWLSSPPANPVDPYYGVDIRSTGEFIFGDTRKIGPYMEGTALGLTVHGSAVNVGKIQSGTSYIDLDASGTPFVHTRSSSAPTYGVDIYDSGEFVFGDTSFVGPHIYGNSNSVTIANANLNVSGGDITTGRISGASGFMDLDATAAASFIGTNAAGVDIKANGTFTFGNALGNHLSYNGTDMNLVGGYIKTSGQAPTQVTIGTTPYYGSIVGEGTSLGVMGLIGVATQTNTMAIGAASTGTGGSGVYSYGDSNGVYGFSTTGTGVYGISTAGFGVRGTSGSSYSGYFDGGLGVYVNGNLDCTGTIQTTGINSVIQTTGSGGIIQASGTGSKLQAVAGGRIVLNQVTISDTVTMVDKALWVDGSGVVHAT